MVNSTHEWHQRYVYQTRWTKQLGKHLIKRSGLSTIQCALEVGCGTGAALQEIILPMGLKCFGIDINHNYLTYARHNLPQVDLSEGDAHILPFADRSFDLCLCHFFLLWADNPSLALREMVRVTQQGGVVIAFAEPDHGNRIDYPPELTILGKWQTESLQSQGADPLLGRQLRALFSRSGLIDIESGILGGEWKSSDGMSEAHMEWNILRSDLSRDPLKRRKLSILENKDYQSRENGERILFVPTFYALGHVPMD